MLYTWHDVESIFQKKRTEWPDGWIDVSVYCDSVVVYQDYALCTEDKSRNFVKEIFKRNYNEQTDTIEIDISEAKLELSFEEEEGKKREIKYAPLFKDIYYSNGKLGNDNSHFKDSKIKAFHSYKGGVGRTLSLVSLLRECTARNPEKMFLVIDADVEAPGLTWMTDTYINASISYLDILNIIHYEKITDEIIKKIANLVKESTIQIETDTTYNEHYFIPVYRNVEQVMDLNSNPEDFLMMQDNKYIITDTISRLAAELGVELAFVDLRAGVSELSAPYLFDSRVDKFYVTSTSMQSVRGTAMLLDTIYKGTESDFFASKIFLTKIPDDMKREDINKVEDRLLGKLETLIGNSKSLEGTEVLRESYIREFKFDNKFIHIDDLKMLCSILRGSGLSIDMGHVAQELFVNTLDTFDESHVRKTLHRINEIAREETTAEGSASSNMLVTSSIKEIARSFANKIPKVVISGAKGSGKTFIYKQLLDAKYWNEFIKRLGTTGNEEKNIVILPLIDPLNKNKIRELRDQCISNTAMELDMEIVNSYVNNNYKSLSKAIESNRAGKMSFWDDKWKEAIINPFKNRFKSLEELDHYLETRKQQLLFVVDGLEELCSAAQENGSEVWKFAVRSVCQDIMNDLEELPYGNIGLIVLVRRDAVSEAITVNYEQFKAQYQKYELNWTQTEALRLVLWLVNKAEPGFAGDIDILKATKPVLVEKLTKLWGIKLGKAESKEAYSDRWIMAALSCFDGQVQARDIVRFLRYATESYAESKLIYKDRYIMPADVKNAIEPCSHDKMQEIKTEMKIIYDTLQKFKNMDTKKLPLTLDKMDITGDEISRLEEQGFLKVSDKQYYLPEIIRLDLGFTYEKGARPRVLSLLMQ